MEMPWKIHLVEPTRLGIDRLSKRTGQSQQLEVLHEPMLEKNLGAWPVLGNLFL